MSETNQLLRKLFNEAVEIADVQQRADYLAAACGADTALRQRIEELLAADAESGRFLGGVGDTVARTGREHLSDTVLINPSIAPPLRRFGDYELLEEIARGGMGIVYKARQVSLDRIVAVKLLLLGQYASEEFIHRFRIEASAAASLQHPNIVAIHEVGVHQGQHYFAMDFVDGPDLAKVVRDGPLTARRAAGYVKTIAEAIHFAHTRRILHRDLKPSNVLIDSNDQPRVTDFGLAKNLASDSELTLTGEVMGSPGFMPPEQASGERNKMGPTSDVYSLGAILYHALTGRAPFVGQSAGDTLQQVQNNEPVAPRLLVPSVPKDLETICLKCLQKEVARRFADAQELAEELGRFLRGEAICSRAVSRGEHVWRWCRRKPAVAGSLASAVLIFALGFAGVTWQWQIARVEKEKARVETLNRDQVSSLLLDLLKGATPEVARGRDTTILRELVGRAETQILPKLADQPLVEAALRATIAGIYESWGDAVKAEAGYREAVAQYRKLLGDDHRDVAVALLGLGGALSYQARYGEAESTIRSALLIQKRVLPPVHPNIAGALHNLAWVLERRGKLNEAEALNRESLAMSVKLFGNEHRDVAISLNALGGVLSEQGKLGEAEALGRQALAMERRVFAEDDPALAVALATLAGTLRLQKKLPEAETLLRESLAFSRKLFSDGHPDLANTLSTLSIVLEEQGKLTEAEAKSREALAMAKQFRDTADPEVAGLLKNLSMIMSKQGKFAEAEALLREGLTMEEMRGGRDRAEVISFIDSLGLVLNAQAKLEEAETMFRDSVLLTKKMFGNDDPKVVKSLSYLALVLDAQGRREEAEVLFREILALRIKQFGPEHPEVAHALNELAVVIRDQNRPAEAEAKFREVLAMRRKLLGNEDLAVARSLNVLATLLTKQGRQKEAESLYREALTTRKKLLVEEHVDVAESLNNLAVALFEQGKLVEAETRHREALTMRKKLLGLSHVEVARSRQNLLLVLELENKHAEAEPLMLEANEILQQNSQKSQEDKRAMIQDLWKFYTDWAVAAPGTGKIQKALEWSTKLRQFDEALRQQTPTAK